MNILAVFLITMTIVMIGVTEECSGKSHNYGREYWK